MLTSALSRLHVICADEVDVGRKTRKRKTPASAAGKRKTRGAATSSRVPKSFQRLLEEVRGGVLRSCLHMLQKLELWPGCRNISYCRGQACLSSTRTWQQQHAVPDASCSHAVTRGGAADETKTAAQSWPPADVLHCVCRQTMHPTVQQASGKGKSSTDAVSRVLCCDVLQSGVLEAPEDEVNYLTAAAGPSVVYAARKFCSVCGFNSA
jgi:hypothetical protein